MAQDNPKEHFNILNKVDERLKNITDCIQSVMPFQIQMGDVGATRTNACLLEKAQIELKTCLANVEYLIEENKI